MNTFAREEQPVRAPVLTPQQSNALAQRIIQQTNLGSQVREPLELILRSVREEPFVYENALYSLFIPAGQDEATLRIPDTSNRYYELTLHALIDRSRAHPRGTVATPQRSPHAQKLVNSIVKDTALLIHLGRTMHESMTPPYGALVVLSSFDYNNPEEHLYVKREPHLVFPMQQRGPVEEWQARNTIYERQKNTLFGLRPIDKKTYEKGVHLT